VEVAADAPDVDQLGGLIEMEADRKSPEQVEA
jgi:hypothetical protein